MKFRDVFWFSAVILAAVSAAGSVAAFGGRLSPRDFNKMYYLASQGKVGILREAVNRGLNIDAVNPNGDTGLCIAIKRKNYVAYNTFRMSGANPRHACTYEINQEYREFLDSNKAVRAEKVVGNEESLYYRDDESSWWPWILGGAAAGGAALAFSGGGGGGSSSETDDTIVPTNPGYGLATLIDNSLNSIDNGGMENNVARSIVNPNASLYLDKISLLPNVLSNSDYLLTYIKISDGAYFNNLRGGELHLGDATAGAVATGSGSKILNNGNVIIDAQNGAIGMAASNGAQAINGPEGTGDISYGKIDITFKGGTEGSAVIGMYGDTNSKIVNSGYITGTTSVVPPDDTGDDDATVGDGGLVNDGEEEDGTAVDKPNSGTILGMVLFDLYTGTNFSANTVTAENNGVISLSAGYNSATDVAVSLIGMGSYIDDAFLNGKNNPAYAEKMELKNYGDINLAYQGVYKLAETALKLGDGGLIGMRADAATEALNQGNIKIDLTSTTMDSETDVASGMLSVHGAQLTNGNENSIYDGTGSETGGTIRIINEANSGGVSYGMLAAKGDGSQTRIYDWKDPKLANYGLIDMQASHAYGMASFAGGDVVNYGVINLGVENGQSYYTGNYGLYGAGDDFTKEILLQNKGTINVYSEKSTAIYNAFAGSVDMINDGYIYLSNKATDSQVFGGKFSSAYNNGSILYKVGNSAGFDRPSGGKNTVGLNVASDMAAAVVGVSGSDSTTKQLFVNNGDMTIGAEFDKNVDYGGTYGTAGVQISKQGAAVNNGTISLKSFDKDYSQFNTGMWLDATATAEAYADNYGDISVEATNSVGMRNDSLSGAVATNYGSIYTKGEWSYGMAAISDQASIFNGKSQSPAGSVNSIYVTGANSVGMYIRDGTAYNYGSIFLHGDNTTAFQLNGEKSKVEIDGTILHGDGYKNIVYFWMTNGASKIFDYPGGIQIEGYTLGKASTDTTGGRAYFSSGSTAYVKGENSHLFVSDGNDSEVYNNGTVEALAGASPLVAQNGGSAYNYGGAANIVVQDASSRGMYATGAESKVESTSGAKVTVNAGGVGLYGDDMATATNGGNLIVNKGIGMYVTDGNGSTYTSGYNTGFISVGGKGNIGAYVVSGARFNNSSGDIFVSCAAGECAAGEYAYGIYSNSSAENDGSMSVGSNSVGMYGSGLTNNGMLTVSSDSAYGIYNLGIAALNSGTLSVYSGIGGYAKSGTITNSGTVRVSNGVGLYATDAGRIENNGEVNVFGGSGLYIKGTGNNTGDITSYGQKGVIVDGGSFINSGTISGSGYGVYVTSGSFTNSDTISMTSGSGIYVENGRAVNEGTIDMSSGNGVSVGDNGSFTNSGAITVGSGNGIYVNGANASASNSGSITLSGSGYGANVQNGTFINTGTITYNGKSGGSCANVAVGGECIDSSADKTTTTAAKDLVYVGENGTFVNGGEVDLNGLNVDFDAMKNDDTGSFVVANGGSYKADSLKGEVVASSDIVMGGFGDTYTNENSFEGKNAGLNVSSSSYMFDATLKDNGDVTDVELNRKEFDKLVEDEDVANFFEANYGLENNEKMYNALKSAGNKEEFDYATEVETGKNFYANLARENMAVLRGLNAQEQNRILEDGLSGSYIGADYYRTGKDAQGGLSGYADNIYSPYIGFGTKLNHNWSVGGTLRAAYADSEYDEADSTRNNKILLAFLPVLYQNNNFKFLTTPSIGAGYGTYKRHALSGTYEADTLDFYYGWYNHAEYSIDVKVAELVTEAELNLQGASMSKAEEDEGLNLHSNSSVSVEAGVGVKLRKRIQLAKERSLMLAIGTKYYHEFSDPYKDLRVGMDGSPVDFGIKAYDEDKNRLRTAAEAVYKDGNIAVAAEIAHNAEKESSVEGGLGVRYNF